MSEAFLNVLDRLDSLPRFHTPSYRSLRDVSRCTVSGAKDAMSKMDGVASNPSGQRIREVLTIWTAHPNREVAESFRCLPRRGTGNYEMHIWKSTSPEMQDFLLLMTRMMWATPAIHQKGNVLSTLLLAEEGCAMMPVARTALGALDRPTPVRHAMATAVSITSAIVRRDVKELPDEIDAALSAVRTFTIDDEPMVPLIHAAVPAHLHPLTEAGVSWETLRERRSPTFLTHPLPAAIRNTFDLLSPED